MDRSGQIIFFDGVCNLCNRFIRFVIRRDPDTRFRFASLQSESGHQLLSELQLPADKLQTVFYLRNGRCFRKSSAALHVLRDLGHGWQLLYGFMIVPRFIRDFIYDLIARNRYMLFGRRESCMVPTPGLRERFLD